MVSFIAAIRVLRAPLLVVAAFAAVVVLADQAREVFLIFAEEPLTYYVPITASLILVVLFSFAVFFLGHALIDNASDDVNAATKCIASVLVYIASAVPVVVLGYCVLSVRGSFSGIAEPAQGQATVAGVLILILAFAIFVIQVRRGRHAKRGFLADRRSTLRVLAFACGVTIAAIACCIFWPLQLGALFGPIGIILLFFTCLLTFLTLMIHSYTRWHIPVISILVLLGCIWSVRGCNQNHAVRTVPTATAQLTTFETAFQKWLGERKDLDKFGRPSNPYPVYLVSAEGGGAYAGFHAAATLARLQDSCPRFAQHVFAISGVSGGSLGAALFASQARELAKNAPALPCDPLTKAHGPFQDFVEKYFDNDFLTPVLAGALFPDFLQFFLPWAIGPFDRVRALEKSFEAAWRKASSSKVNTFENSFHSLWDASGATPALILNTTETAAGSRELIAPFTIDLISSPSTVSYIGAKIDLPLSTAVALSARFPWVTPAGIVTSDEVEFQFADGGYFENSGVETAHNLIREIQRVVEAKQPAKGVADAATDKSDPNTLTMLVNGEPVWVSFKLIIIHAENIPAFKTTSGEMLAPLRAMLSARSERGHAAVRSAFMSMCPQCNWRKVSLADNVRFQTLEFRTHPIPLGWWLSRNNRTKIVASVGDSHLCALHDSLPEPEVLRGGDLRDENNCLYEFIVHDLTKEPKK
jgi:hypothetical protein